VRVSKAENSNGRAGSDPAEEGVLSKLPHTRPQRSSPRRAAARKAASAPDSSNGAAQPAIARPAETGAKRARKAPSPRPAKARARTSASAARTPRSTGREAAAGTTARDQVPRQGFESEMDRVKGPVQPPGGAELVGSAAEIVADLARTGLSTGERLLRDALARLPL